MFFGVFDSILKRFSVFFTSRLKNFHASTTTSLNNHSNINPDLLVYALVRWFGITANNHIFILIATSCLQLMVGAWAKPCAKTTASHSQV